MADNDLGLGFSECETVEIRSTWRNIGNKVDSDIQTTEIKTASSECNTEQLVSVDTQTGGSDVVGSIPVTEENAGAISAFLQKHEAMVTSEIERTGVNELAFESLTLEEDREDVKKQLSLQQNTMDKHGKMKPNKYCSDVAWNSTGSIVAVSYGRSDHNGWCEHQSTLCTWNVMDRKMNEKQADLSIELPCCLMCIAFHPSQPTIIAGGLFNGEIRVWDIANQEEPLLMTSKIDDLFHREPISNIIWVRDFLESQKRYTLVSSSTDGKVLTWNPANKLAYPRGGHILIPTKAYHGHGVTVNRYPVMGATSVSYSIDASNFVIGTEAGGLVKSLYYSKLGKKKGYVKSGEWRYSVEAARLLECVDDTKRYEVKRHIERYINERDGKKVVEIEDMYSSRPKPTDLFPNGSKLAFEPHSGPIYQVCFSPFHRNLFLSCSTDGTLRLYNILKTKPLVYLEPTENYLFDVAWSTGRPLVFAAADGKGSIFIYDLLADMLSPVQTFSLGKKASKITALSFNPDDPSLLTSADVNGRIVTWLLGGELSQTQQGEKHMMEMMGGSNANTATNTL